MTEEIDENRLCEPHDEEWQFNRYLNIQKIVAIAQRRASQPMAARHYLKDEDRIVEKILDSPLPFNEYVDFNDDSDRSNSDLSTLCTRLAVRLETLRAERERVKSSPWSSDQDTRVKLIDEARELVEFVLNDPTTNELIIEKRLANYKGDNNQKAACEYISPATSFTGDVPADNDRSMESCPSPYSTQEKQTHHSSLDTSAGAIELNTDSIHSAGGMAKAKKWENAKELAIEITKDRWGDDKRLTVHTIATSVRKVIEADLSALNLKKTPALRTIKNWIRPYAPSEAILKGRPPNNR